jgi:hypothetical protein
VTNLIDHDAGCHRPDDTADDSLLIASWYPDLLAWIEMAGRSMTGPRRGPEVSQGWWSTLDLPSS